MRMNLQLGSADSVHDLSGVLMTSLFRLALHSDTLLLNFIADTDLTRYTSLH